MVIGKTPCPSRLFIRSLSFLFYCTALTFSASASEERTLRLSEVTDTALSFRSEVGEDGEFTWWLPDGALEYVLPISAGVVVDVSRSDLMLWLRAGSPWSLSELPALGLRYDDEMLIVITPWPHYAELIIADRVESGGRF